MAWNAVEALKDARSATESFLWPIHRSRWLRLALVAFFVGGSGGTLPQGGGNVGNVGGGGGGTPGGGLPSDVPTPSLPPMRSLLGVLLALLVVGVVLFLLYAVASAVFEFVLVDGLVDRDVHIRAPFRAHLGTGLRLFAFRVAVLLVALAVVAIPLLLVVAGGVGISPALLLFVLPLLAVFALVGIVVAVVMRLTTDFVVPTMLAEGHGVLGGWRRLLGVVRAHWQEFALYVVVRFVLGVGVGIGVGILMALVAVVLALPFLLVAGVIFGVAAATGPGVGLLGWVGIGIVALLWLLAVLVAGLFVQAPVVTYFRYYALFFLGRNEEALDLVADLRPPETTDDDSRGNPGNVTSA